MVHFDFARTAEEAGIAPARLRQLCEAVRRDFPIDDMLYELHVLRACMAVRDKLVSLDELLRSETAAQTA